MNEKDMSGLIKERLDELEKKENIRILYAAESGSRSWMATAPDSDYDVRFIYIREPTEYLRLDKPSDVIELPLEDNFDMSGWDLFKALGLLKKSNPRLFEWMNSPVVYKDDGFSERFRPLAKAYFSPKSTMLHYLHTAKKQRDHFLKGEEVKVKKYLYTLHPLMAAAWVSKNGTPPPVVYRKLMESELPWHMYGYVDALLERKIRLPEQSEIIHIPVIDDYIDEEIMRLEKKIPHINEAEVSDYEMLSAFFLSELKRSWK